MDFKDRMAVSGDVHTSELATVVDYLGYPGLNARGHGRFVLSDTTTVPTLTFDLFIDSLEYKAIHGEKGRILARLTRAFRTPEGRGSTWLAPMSVGPL